MGNPLILQSDFGLGDGAVSAMCGVANCVDQDLKIYNLTHEIPPFDIWEGSYRLLQTIAYWPQNSVFVSVVDPGVGTDRRSVVARTASNHFIVTPDNGTLTHVNKEIGITEMRLIDETVNRLPNSGASHTFHGRDIYAYTGARLAAGLINFEQVGPLLDVDQLIKLPSMDAFMEDDVLHGIIDVLDVRYGNVWTNISRLQLADLQVQYGNLVKVTIKHESAIVFEQEMVYGRSFAATEKGESLIYINSLDNIAVAINQQSFAKKYKIGTGVDWKVFIKKS
ncbi:MAG TPA: DNA-directed RNA polymerase subunit delta [Bacillus bacterium]|uniref:SAM hydrolase/SAM-dependent halogenase family protein n=1 Tax=Siminovitchia fordii TaxID=254759 RepID=UPI000370057A|nr:S-adenosyl-l-methionine hydroxide adenosyltransferase family protein [Siminovitchia fordii]HBZ11060.1 DNA-directed RNA polymerase subunit delta [Bacillus sp. (in: firmicutes)]